MTHYKTISEWSRAWQLPGPKHPLTSVLKVDTSKAMRGGDTFSSFSDFYCIAIMQISLAEGLDLRYGQQPYGLDEGVMSFIAPGQVTSLTVEKDMEAKQRGWYLLFHPDLLWNTPLASTIKRYEFWNYAVNEALSLAEQEEEVIIAIVKNIHRKTHTDLDRFSMHIIISQLEGLLNYAERFYNRQFIARDRCGHTLLERLEIALNDHLKSGRAAAKGLPTVADIAAMLHITPNTSAAS